ncbi:Nuclear pore complex protein NUP96 [Rhynchospora pubera]|uniref:Nuclear pore complex protein NUP96 n=1 Tax=Rhynchospora pubera TaxID=906938 RepID=A0AAV8FYI9_9POAL|nr:Nuclear pore complex protein NUP96 [Rhynchospora pubera]
MASAASLSPCGVSHIEGTKSNNSYSPCCSDRFSVHGDACLPILNSTDYYTLPSLDELYNMEHCHPGYCSQVPDFEIGRGGYGCIRFTGLTDLRGVNLDETVKFNRNSVTVYKDEANKPPLGHGLNKPAEVTLMVHPQSQTPPGLECPDLESKLKACNEEQGTRFISFDPLTGEWRFTVDHFSRFGLDDLDEEEDEDMEDSRTRPISIVDDSISNSGYGPELSHSLPANLRLDPVKMQETRMLMLSDLNEEEEFMSSLIHLPSNRKYNLNTGTGRKKTLDSPSHSVKGKGLAFGSPVHGSPRQSKENIFSPSTSKSPTQLLLEYNVGNSDLSPHSGILLTGQNKGPPVRLSKAVGFKLEEEHLHDTPVSSNMLTNCVVDAALFMGQSFRVGWGPNGLLVHSGSPVRDPGCSLSSVIHLERVALDRSARDKNEKINKELVDLCFSSPMEFHKSLTHESEEIDSGSHKLTLFKVVADQSMLHFICRNYVEILEKQHGVTDFPNSSRTLLVHTISVWELIRVLFFEGDANAQLDLTDDDMVLDTGIRGGTHEPDEEALPFAHRAGFSYWLQESVVIRVDEDINCLTDNSYLEQILVLLTGRQLDQAVELAVSHGDVRLGILISQAGGSMINRSDMSQQLELWRINGLDFSLIEQNRLKIYELLSGNVHTALQGQSVDWKRYLGLILWYQLAPDTTIPAVINTYQQLLNEGKVPYPVPVYIDEGPLDDAPEPVTDDRFDMLYYLMLLHANNEEEGLNNLVKAMLSALSSSYDPLDHHMIWHQRSVLQAIGAVDSADLHLLDMSFVYQLLGLGMCHWAIYVVMHMPYVASAPYLHEKVIREVLLQHVELWSRDEVQKMFLDDLGVPSEWMSEALAIYYEYNGDNQKALENYIGCANWGRAHIIFMKSVAHSLFLNAKHSEIWRITSSMEAFKDEISDWDLGAGIYIDFYDLRSSMKEEVIMNDMDLLEKRKDACKSFFERLNDSLVVWGARIPVAARVTYSKMVEELNSLLVSTPGGNSTPDIHMSCFNTMLEAPLPEDQRSTHLQEAISIFTYVLSDDSVP